MSFKRLYFCKKNARLDAIPVATRAIFGFLKPSFLSRKKTAILSPDKNKNRHPIFAIMKNFLSVTEFL